MLNLFKINKIFWILLLVATLVSASCVQSQPTPVVTYSLNVTISGQGTTNPSPGGYTYYDVGQSAIIIATPSTGWQFDHWSGDASGTYATTSVSMDRNKSVTANFKRQPFQSGPSNLNIGTGSDDFTISARSIDGVTIDVGDRVDFDFTVTGADVFYSVLDPYGNIVLNGSGGNKVPSGQGSFIAATFGNYKLHFVSSETLTPSVLTIYYTVYFAR